VRARAFLAAAVAVTCACATTKPQSSSVRITGEESSVAGCERLGEIEVPRAPEAIPQPDHSLAGTDTIDRSRWPFNLSSRTADSLRYWVAQKGGDTVLVTSVKATVVRGIACRCDNY
jgi:hypothetical protein